ncbi:hypothetical protein FACS189455_0130 [Bacteroidia bacterium]|nr:hypothetical protein FACS189455_0130 [Bacteroidia bacterium]
MNKIVKYVWMLGTAVALFGSCSDDSFYAVPIEFQGAKDVFTDSIKAGRFINNAYTEQPADVAGSFNWMDGNAMFASVTDEAMHIQSNKSSQSAAQRMSAGNWNPSNMRYYRSSDGAGEIGRWMKWGGYHGNRKANTAIKYIPLLPTRYSQRYRDRLMGEAVFLRAIQHFHLFQMWGGIPIVDVSFEASDDVQIPRNTVEETVDFISKEMLRAAEFLPETPYVVADEVGRVSRGACYAYCARALLYAASPLYNGSGFDGKSNILICYGNTDPNRWKPAAEAAQMAIDLGWYELFKNNGPTPNTTNASNANTSFGTTPIGKGQENYHQLFNEWGANNNNNEMIFGRIRGTNRDTENDNFPAGFTNSKGGTCPSQNLVDDYEMNDGTLFNWNNPTHKEKPYDNRDPRFYATIIYDGAAYRRFANQTSTYTFDITDGGKNKPNNGLTNTETGYYLYKFLNYYDCNPAGNSGGSFHVWMDMRFAEVLLNYAEAANEFGGPDYVVSGAKRPLTPVQAIDSIRTRAGMPSVQASLAKRGQVLTKETLREFIRHERRIELAFENHRYFDVRRWMIIEQLPGYIRGMKISKTGSNKTYDPNVVAENKVFAKKHYFFPIPQVEINRNKQLVQNPEW